MGTKIVSLQEKVPFAWWMTKDGTDFQPANTGRLGAFPIGTILTVGLSVDGDYSCFTIDSQDPSRRIFKKGLGEGVFEKKITILEGNGQGLVARWPNNVVCLDVADRHFTIGVQQQRGIFYLIIEEYTPDLEMLSPGQVKWFSALRGFGAITSENQLFDFKIHWTACPKRGNGLRYLNTGERVTWKYEDEADVPSSSTFLREIKRLSTI